MHFVHPILFTSGLAVILFYLAQLLLPVIGLALSTERNYQGDWLKDDLDKEMMGYTREQVTIVSGQNLKTGTVLGKITASGKYSAYDGDAADGTQTVAGILIGDVDATLADTPGAILARGPAEIDGNRIVWVSQDAGDIADGLAALAALNIINRPGSTVTGPV